MSAAASENRLISHRFLLDALAEHDLRLPHVAILAALSDFGPLAQYELADCRDIQRSHLVRHVDLLEERGFVQRERDPEDRRRQNVVLTKSGREMWRRMRKVAEQSQTRFLDVLSESERKTLLTLLRRATAAPGARVPTRGPLARLFKLMGKRQIRTYRRSGAERLSSQMAFPVVLLTTRGAKTGTTRTTPVGGFPDQEDSWRAHHA